MDKAAPQIFPVRTGAFFACLAVGRVLKPDLRYVEAASGRQSLGFKAPPRLVAALRGVFFWWVSLLLLDSFMATYRLLWATAIFSEC